jgi:hypothetical protein
VKQNPSRPIVDGGSELSSKLRLATSGVGYNGDEPFTEAGVDFVEKSAGATDVGQCVRYSERRMVATGSQVAWEFCQLLTRRGWAVGELLPQKVKVASVQDGMRVSERGGYGAGEVRHLRRRISERAGHVVDVTVYCCSLGFELGRECPQIIPDLGLTEHSSQCSFCVYGLVDFWLPSWPDGRDSQLVQLGQAVRCEDEVAEVGSS